MSKLFNKMYIGNPNKKDLTKKDIEKESRFQLFFTVIKVRGWNLLGLNLLYTLFLIPLMIVLYFAMYQYYSMLSGSGTMGFEDLFMYIYLLFPCFLIACPGTLGFTNVLHRWANDEHAWMSDFWTGIRKNWKQGLIVTVINYVVMFLLFFCFWFYREPMKDILHEASETTFSVSTIAQYFIFGCAIVYIMIHMYVFPMLVRYKLTIKEIYKFSLILAFRDFFGSMALTVIIGIVLFLLFEFVPTLAFWILMGIVLIVFFYLIIYVHIGKVLNKNVFLDIKDY